MATSDSTVLETPRILLVGAGKGVGVSTLTLGLISALRRASVSVATGKVGPTLVTTTHHRRVSGRLAHSFDPWMLSARQCIDSLARLSSGAEMMIIEGQLGLHDERLEDGSFVTEAELSLILKTPVVLVINARGLGESVAALVAGYAQYHPKLSIRGVIANFVEDDAHDEQLRFAITRLAEQIPALTYLGGVRSGDATLLGGIEGAGHFDNASLLSRSRLVAAADLVQASVDLNALQRVAATASPIEAFGVRYSSSSGISRVAVADDQAFHMLYQENLDLIRRSGAELVAFSPLADQKLPSRIKGVYLPSGYMHLYASDLEANVGLMDSLRNFAFSGGAIFAEGNAVGMLCNEVELFGGRVFSMSGILPATASAIVSESHYMEPVYCEVSVRSENIVAAEGMRFRGVRDIRFAIRLREAVVSCFDTVDRTELNTTNPEGPLIVQEGLSPLPNVLATTVSANWASEPLLAQHFTRMLRSIDLTPAK